MTSVLLGLVLGLIIAASLYAASRLLWGSTRVLAPDREAMRTAVHAATSTLPHLRRGLSRESAGRSIVHLHALTQASAVALADHEVILAFAGPGGQELPIGEPLPAWLALGRDDRLHVEPRLRERMPHLPFGAAAVAPLQVRNRLAGCLIALYDDDERLRPDHTRVVSETAALIGAQLELAEIDQQEERLARAELRALRAQISPHFIYNALAAVAGFINTRPDEARELLAEFADFTRYAFRGQRSHVTLADELHYVEKYLRLEQARFGDRLAVRVTVPPEILGAVVPVLSLQPLVENAVRHGLESHTGRCRVEILGRDLDGDVEICVRDDGCGMTTEEARRALAGACAGIGLSNVHSRLQSTFGPEYGLVVESQPRRGTTVRMTLPKFRVGVRVA